MVTPPSELKRFYESTHGANKVVVVDLGFLGDTVHLIPPLWEIKRHYPEAELHVVSAPVGADVLQLAPCVDRVWALTLDPAKRSLREQWNLVRALRNEKFDVAYNFNGGDRTNLLTALTGARRRVAHAGGRRHFYNRWLIPNWAPKQNEDMAVYEQRRRFLADCGFTLEAPQFNLKVTGDLIAWADATIPAGALHVSVNSATPFNEWPVENYAAMLNFLWERLPALQVVASGSAKERELERLHQLRSSLNDPRFRLLPANLSIPQLAAVLRRARLHLGPDSGVVHLAMALGVPTAAFFREQRGYKSFLPQGPQHRAITVPCECLQQRSVACLSSGRTECFARIEPARLAELVYEQLMAGGNRSSR